MEIPQPVDGIIPPRPGPGFSGCWTPRGAPLILHAMKPRTHCVLGLLALVLAPAVPLLPPGTALAAQSTADSGTFIIRHGRDTVATERFARTPTSLKGTLDIRNAQATSQTYEAVVAPDASVPLIQVTVREDQDSGRVKAKLVRRARVIFREDSAAVDDATRRGIETRVFGSERGAVPYMNLSFALLEQAVRRLRAGAPGATQVPFFNLNGGQTLDATVSSLGGDSVAVAIGSIEFHLRVDPAGRVLGGSIPAQQVVAERRGGS